MSVCLFDTSILNLELEYQVAVGSITVLCEVHYGSVPLDHGLVPEADLCPDAVLDTSPRS